MTSPSTKSNILAKMKKNIVSYNDKRSELSRNISRVNIFADEPRSLTAVNIIRLLTCTNSGIWVRVSITVGRVAVTTGSLHNIHVSP